MSEGYVFHYEIIESYGIWNTVGIVPIIRTSFGDKLLPVSHAFFCRRTGKLWARIYCVDSKEWELHNVVCREMDENPRGAFSLQWEEIPGSILDYMWLHAQNCSPSRHPLTLDYLPDVIIKREFEVHLNHFLKETENEQETTDSNNSGSREEPSQPASDSPFQGGYPESLRLVRGAPDSCAWSLSRNY